TGGTVASVVVDQGKGSDLAVVQSTTDGTATTVNSGGGNDTVVVAVDAAAGYDALQVDGGTGTNALKVVDATDPAVMHTLGAGSGVVDGSYLAGQDSQIKFSNLQGVVTSADPTVSYIREVYHTVLHRDPTDSDLVNSEKVLLGPGGASAFVQSVVTTQ